MNRQETASKTDWSLLRKTMAHMINGSPASEVFNISRDGGIRFAAACDMHQRALFPMSWTKETVLETFNPITSGFSLQDWIALIEHTGSDRIRKYAFEACLIAQIAMLEKNDWKIYDYRFYQIGRFLQTFLKFPQFLKQFPDEAVMVFEKGFLAHLQKMNSLTNDLCAQLVLTNDFLSAASEMKFVSLTNDFARIKNGMLAQLPRIARIQHDYFLSQMNDERNYYKASAYHNTIIFKLLFSWTAWKHDSECMHLLNPMIQESLHPLALLPFFEILLACDEARRGTFRIESFNQHFDTLFDLLKKFSEDYGIPIANILMRDDFARMAKYWAGKIA